MKLRAVMLLGISLVLAPVRADAVFPRDDAFGVAGTVVLEPAVARGVAVQTSGKIILLTQTDGDLVLLRLGGSGTIDASFGIDGRATAAPFFLTVPPPALAVQADDRILVASGTEAGEIRVARFLPDGAPDTAYGESGVATVSLPPPGCGYVVCHGGAVAVALDARQRALVIGSIADTHDRPVIALVRLTTDGELDATFGDGGVATTATDDGASELPASLAVTQDGRVVVVGTQLDDTSAPAGFVLATFTADGTLDPEFGTGGRASLPIPSGGSAADVVVDGRGRIVVASSMRATPSPGSRVLVTRWLASGTLDRTFGSRGRALGGVDRWENSARWALALPSGAILVGAASSLGFGGPCPAAPSVALLAFDRNGRPSPDDELPGDSGSPEAALLQADGKPLLVSTDRYVCYVVRPPQAHVTRLLPIDVSSGPSGPISIRPRGAGTIPLTPR